MADKFNKRPTSWKSKAKRVKNLGESLKKSASTPAARWKTGSSWVAKHMEGGTEMRSPMKKYIGFNKLSKKIQSEGKSKASADAIAASIGRKKYGSKGFNTKKHG